MTLSFIRKVQCNQNWNVGFCELTPDAFIASGCLGRVAWMKNPYRDRWFADPFILRVSGSEIVIFVEERKVLGTKGYLTELVVDRSLFEIKNRYVILETDSHLSYPAIIRKDGHIFVCPENALGGPLKLYEYDVTNHRLFNPRVILTERVADSTILEIGGKFYMIAVKYPDSLEKAYLYESEKIDGPFKQVCEEPIQLSVSCSRPGGDFFYVNRVLYRPAQNCEKRYGGSLTIMRIDGLNPFYEEKTLSIQPFSFKYNMGVHTLNFHEGIAVIDGYGYYYPLIGRLYFLLRGFLGKK